MPVPEKGQAALARQDPVLPIRNPAGPSLLARGPLWAAIPPKNRRMLGLQCRCIHSLTGLQGKGPRACLLEGAVPGQRETLSRP